MPPFLFLCAVVDRALHDAVVDDRQAKQAQDQENDIFISRGTADRVAPFAHFIVPVDSVNTTRNDG